MIFSFIRVNATNKKAISYQLSTISNQLSAISKADTTLVNRDIELRFDNKTNNPLVMCIFKNYLLWFRKQPLAVFVPTLLNW